MQKKKREMCMKVKLFFSLYTRRAYNHLISLRRFVYPAKRKKVFAFCFTIEVNELKNLNLNFIV